MNVNTALKVISVWFILVVLIVGAFYLWLYLIGLWHIIDFSTPAIDFTQYPDDTYVIDHIVLFSYGINLFVLIYFFVVLLVKWFKKRMIEKIDVVTICLAVITLWLMYGKYGYRLILE